MEYTNRLPFTKIGVSIELTNLCNFKCKYCPHSYYKKEHAGNIFDRKKGFINDEVFQTCNKFVKEYANFLTIGFFGEQTLHKDFCRYSNILNENRTYTMHLNTNFSHELTDKIIQAYGCYDRIRISLDALDKETYDYLCPSVDGMFEKVTENIKNYLKIKNRPQVAIIFVRSEHNKDSEHDFVKFWKQFTKGNDIIVCKSVLSYGGVVLEGIRKQSICPIKERPVVNIAWNGDISPCNLDVNIEYNSGNIMTGFDIYKHMETIKNKQGICRNCEGTNHTQRIS